jgi:hypothetical protein
MKSRRNKTIVVIIVLLLLAAIVPFNIVFANRIPKEANAALENGTTFKLLSLRPEMFVSGTPNEGSERPLFYGYAILGETEITSTTARKELLGSLRKAVSHGPSTAARCFNPRHAIRVTNNGTQFDFLICFECRRMRVISSGETNYVSLKGDQTTFDNALSQAHIPLPPPPRH